jgi:hypothetical protein
MVFFVTVAGLSKAQGHLAEPTDPGRGGLDVASLVSQHSGLVAAKDTVGAGAIIGLLWAVIAFVGKSKGGEFVPAFGHIHQLVRVSMCLLLFVVVAGLGGVDACVAFRYKCPCQCDSEILVRKGASLCFVDSIRVDDGGIQNPKKRVASMS